MKLKLVYYLYFCIFYCIPTFGQVGLNTETPHASSILELNTDNKGLLLPRVALLSTTDIVTIENPATGLMVFATEDAGTGNEAIVGGNMYKFDGTKWNMFTSRSNFIEKDLPQVIAYGIKTTENGCNNVSTAFFNLNQISNPSILTATGAFTAPKTGYYSFSVKVIHHMASNPGQSFNQGPFIRSEGLVTSTYKFRGLNWTEQRGFVSGIVYLTENQTTAGFQWNLGVGNICGTTGLVKRQEVIWEYLGNPQ